MNLSCIVYLSESLVDFEQEQLLQLIKDARDKNGTLGITGYLCFFRGRFIQYIEGTEPELYALFERISADSRHKVLYHEISTGLEHRRFPSWGMRMIGNDDLKRYNVEVVLENNLLYLKNDFPNTDAITNNVWQLVNTIAKLHG